jgi:hypothetical protein
MSQAHSQMAEGEQMQGVHQGEGINVQGWAEPGLRTMICWWGHWCRFVDKCRHHQLISIMRERASFEISLPYSVKFGNTLEIMKHFTSIEKIDTAILYLLELTSGISVLLLAFGLIASMANVLTKGSVLTENLTMQHI